MADSCASVLLPAALTAPSSNVDQSWSARVERFGFFVAGGVVHLRLALGAEEEADAAGDGHRSLDRAVLRLAERPDQGFFEGVLDFHASARERHFVSAIGQGGDERVLDHARSVLRDDRHQKARLLLHVGRGGLVGRLVVAGDELDELVARGFVVRGRDLAASRQVDGHSAGHHVAVELVVHAVEVLGAVS